MSVINATPLLAAAGGDYQISRSVRLRSSASAYLDRTFTTPTSRRIFTLSAWTKRGALGATAAILGNAGTREVIGFFGNTSGNGDALHFRDTTNGAYEVTTTAVFRDPSAWYHIVVAFDTTQATASNRVKMYVNGVQQTSFAVATYPSQNTDLNLNSAVVHAIGRRGDGASYYLDGYLTEVNFIDGQALTPSSFGETDSITGVWKPKKYAGTYGTNGFFLNFSDNSSNTATTIGKDYSGNGNNWTPNNISVTAGVTYDSMLDVPTPYADGGNGRGNYATLNPLNANRPTILDGNIRVAGGDRFALSTIGMTSGQWYAEMTVTTVGTETSCGIAKTDNSSSGSNYVGSTSDSYGYYAGNGNKYNNGSSSAYGATYTSGDVIGIAFDADAGTLVFYKNNTSQGTAYTGLTSGPYYFAIEGRSTGTANNVSINFGQRPFAYTPPTGFKALNTQNLPEPTIKKGNQYFDATLYTGTGSSQAVTNASGFQPDFLWLKNRSYSSGASHRLFDSARGTNALYSNLTNAEANESAYFSSLNSNGFTVTGNDQATNFSGSTYVGWQWKAGGAGSSNTSGSITSTVSVNATAGFSIVTYTGAGGNSTVGHGLGVAPSMIIIKQRSGANDWPVYHASLGNTGGVYLDLTNAFGASAAFWNNTSPTSTVFTVGNSSDKNGSGQTYVAYCFSAVAGYSAFGKYTGNGSTDGPFVFLGFKPRFILIKRTDAVDSWRMYDSARNPYNAGTYVLYPNLSNAEDASVDHFDWLSNGFKTRSSSNNNASGGTYIYAAFAESPFKTSLAR